MFGGTKAYVLITILLIVSSSTAAYIFNQNFELGLGKTDIENKDAENKDAPKWHYTVPVEVRSGLYEREDRIISITLNITKEIGGYGEFDPNSVSVKETNETWSPRWESVMQQRWLDEHNLEVSWLMNGTTPANTTRYYNILFDIMENGPKEEVKGTDIMGMNSGNGAGVNVEVNEDGHLWISGVDYEVKIDVNRGGSRVVKYHNSTRKGYVYDTGWMSWHSDDFNWRTKGADVELMADGPLYAEVEITSADGNHGYTWTFYPKSMHVELDNNTGNLSFDTFADNFINTQGTLVWSDGNTEELRMTNRPTRSGLPQGEDKENGPPDDVTPGPPSDKTDGHDDPPTNDTDASQGPPSNDMDDWLPPGRRYTTHQNITNYFYIIGPEDRERNASGGFWAVTENALQQTVYCAGEKGLRWEMNGTFAWFGFSEYENTANMTMRYQYPPSVIRHRTIVQMVDPTITDDVSFVDQLLYVEGDMNIKQGGRLDMNDMEVHIEGSICEWSNSFTTIQDSRLHFVEAGEGNFYLYSEGECNLLDSVVYTDEGHSLRVVVQNVANIRDSSFRNLLKGVEVYSDNVEIININIKNSNGAGILVGEGYTPVINGGEISKCQYGILMGAEEMEPLQTSESGIMGAKPTVDVSYSPDTPAPEDGVRFKGECTGVDFDNGDEWNWEFSGPHTVVKDYYDSSLDELVAYVYWTSTGTYEVSLTITRTSDGQTATDETEITVTVSEVEVNFEYTPTSPLTSETVSFSDDSVIPAGWSIVGYEWTIDGGWYSDDSDWDHQFDTPGDYEVELTITIEDDQGNKNDYSKTKTVTVEANKPKAYFSYSIDGLKVYFTDESKPRAGNIESYQWEFGDEDTSTIKNPTHTYDSRGEYVVRLTVENSYGKSDSYTETIAVGKPVAKIFEYKTVGHYEEEDDGMWRMTVELDGSGSMSEWGTIESYKWEFVEHDGDVTVIEGTDKGIVTHTYESPNPVVGFHLPRLTVTDDIGLTHTTSTRVVAYYKSGHTVSNLKVFDNDIGIYITGGTGTQAGAVGERISVSGNYVNLFDCTVCDNTVGIQSEGIHFALKDTYVFNNDVSTRLDGLGGRTFMIPVTGSYDRNPGLLEFENFASEWNPDEDWDGDGLSWTDELWMYGTDPTLLSDLNIDSDGDGITNNDEADVYGTDPLRPDTDRDGVLDGDDLFPFYDALLKLNVRETGEGEENLLTAGEPLAWTVWEDKWYSGLPQRYERTFGFDEHGVTLPRNIPDYRSYIDSYLEFTVWDYQYGARTIFYELRHDVSDGSTTYLDKSNLGLWEPTDNGYVVLYRCDERDIELEMKMFTAPEINPGRQRMLAEQHAPILRFNEGENFFPTHVENFLEQSSLYDGDGMLIKDEVTSQDLVDNSGPENYLALDYDDAVEPYDYNVYSRVATARDDWIVIQYWFFYVYDDKDIVPGTDIEKHEGDWEMIQIELTPYGAPLSVGYSQHYGGELAWWYDIEKEDDSPVVYVAKGSHASYPESGGWQIGGYGEEYKGNGDELHPLDYTITFSDNHPWLQFQGKWGSDSGSVPGPVYRHSKPHDVLPSGPQAYIWIEPVRWQEVSLDIWS